jgi:hypothetical protein
MGKRGFSVLFLQLPMSLSLFPNRKLKRQTGGLTLPPKEIIRDQLKEFVHTPCKKAQPASSSFLSGKGMAGTVEKQVLTISLPKIAFSFITEEKLKLYTTEVYSLNLDLVLEGEFIFRNLTNFLCTPILF